MIKHFLYIDPMFKPTTSYWGLKHCLPRARRVQKGVHSVFKYMR